MPKEEQKTITFFDFANLNYGGGAEINFMNLGAWLQERNYIVNFVTPSRSLNRILSFIPIISDYPSNISPAELVEKFKVHNYITFSLKDLFFNTQKRRQILNIFDLSNVIYSKNEIFEVMILKIFFLVDFGKTVFGFHTPLTYPSTKGIKSKLHNLIYQSKFYLKLLRNSHVRCLVLTNSDQEYFIKSGAQNMVSVIPNPINTIKFSLKEFHKRNIFNISYIGRMTEQKGIDTLSKAITLLSKHPEFSSMIFRFIGSGPEENLLKEIAKDYQNLLFVGFQSEVVNEYQQADLVVSPSRWESFCYTVAEAQSCGIPVISTNIPGPKDIIIKDITGWLIEPNNPEILCAYMIKSYNMWKNDFNSYVQMGINARGNIEQNFKREKINNAIVEFLFSVDKSQ